MNDRPAATPFMTVSGVARRLAVSDMTVYRLIRSKQLRAYRFGHSYRIDPRDFVDYVRDNKTNGA